MTRFRFSSLPLLCLVAGPLCLVGNERASAGAGTGAPRAQTQMVPSAPILNFQYPRFAENGYTQWVLRGAKAYYDSEEQIRVDDMALRLYTADERMAVEMTLLSPFATLRLAENRAYGEDRIEIEGLRFSLSGSDWDWLGTERLIRIREDARVRFRDALPANLSTRSEAQSDATATATATAAEIQTTIESSALELETADDVHRFEFTGNVDLRSHNLHLRSGYLLALADPPPERTSIPGTGSTATGSLRHALARESVIIAQNERLARAEEAEFFPAEDRVILSGRPSITLPGAYVGGSRISLSDGEAKIESAQADGRAQLILTQTGGLGLRGAGALSSETIVLADTILLLEEIEENRFLFSGQVEVLSGGLRMTAESLIVRTGRVPLKDAPLESAETPVTLISLEASGSVKIQQNGQTAEGDQVTFFPAEERALLTGTPRISADGIEVTGEEIELRPGGAIARAGDTIEIVTVTLPQLPDMGYASSAVEKADDASSPAPTIIRSKRAEMNEREGETLFTFSEAVTVEGTNLSVQAGQLAVRAASTGPRTERATDGLQVERIDAFENVVLQQGQRIAKAGRATFLPSAGSVTLEDSPEVEEPDRGRVTGHRMTLLQGERRAIVEGGPDGERARITLPEIPSNMR